MKSYTQLAFLIFSTCLPFTSNALEKSLMFQKSQVHFQAGADKSQQSGYVSKSIESNGKLAAKTTYVKEGKLTNYRVLSGKNKGRSSNLSKDLTSGETSKTTIKTKQAKDGSITTTTRTRSQGKISIEKTNSDDIR